MLWTITRKARNHCQDVDNCGEEDHCRYHLEIVHCRYNLGIVHCRYHLGIDHCQTGNRCEDREHCQNGNEHADR